MRDQLAQRLVAIEPSDDLRQKRRERDDLQWQPPVGSRRDAVGRDDARDWQSAKDLLGGMRKQAVRHDNRDIRGVPAREQRTDGRSDRTARAEEIIDDERRTAANLADELMDLDLPAAEPCLVNRRDRKVEDAAIALSQFDGT